MKSFYVITLFPDFIESYCQFGVLKSAITKKIIDLKIINLRDFAIDDRGTVDDKPYGGGDGMIMRPEPIANAIQSLHSEKLKIVFTSPKGSKFNQEESEKLGSCEKDIVFICGRFGGIDNRIIEKYVHQTYTIGDYIISGGELPTLTILDSVSRTLDGVLGNKDSYYQDSFTGSLKGKLEYPQYTRPEIFEGKTVPKELTSGNHSRINSWRSQESLRETQVLRPDLLDQKK